MTYFSLFNDYTSVPIAVVEQQSKHFLIHKLNVETFNVLQAVCVV